MRKEIEKLGIITEEISDENVDFLQVEPVARRRRRRASLS